MNTTLEEQQRVRKAQEIIMRVVSGKISRSRTSQFGLLSIHNSFNFLSQKRFRRMKNETQNFTENCRAAMVRWICFFSAAQFKPSLLLLF